MSYAHVTFDHFSDPAGAMISAKRSGSLRTRGGVMLNYTAKQPSESGVRQSSQSSLYGLANLVYEWLDCIQVDVSGTPIRSRDHPLRIETGAGGIYRWNGNRFALYAELSADTALGDFASDYSLKGTVGFRARF